MKLGIDLDGVVYNYTKDFEEYARSFPEWEHSLPLTFSSWDFYTEWGLTTEEFLQIQADGVMAGKIFRRGEAYPDAIPTLRKLKEDGHEIHIITHRHGTRAQISTLEWLQENGVSYDKLTFAEDKTTSHVDIMVDDRPKNVEASLKAGIPVVMMRQSWNESDTDLYPWIDGWDEFYEIVDDPERYRLMMAINNHCRAKLFGDGGSEDDEIRTTSSTGGQKGVKTERPDLIPVPALKWLSIHYGKGAEKYDDHNWRKGYEWSKSYSSMLRHAHAFWGGEDNDPELGTPHMAAVMFHAAALLTFMEEHPEFDDRWKLNA